MKLYFNSNLNLVKEEDTDAYEGSSNYDDLFVYVDAEWYNSYTSTGAVYPSYATLLPNGRRTMDIDFITSADNVTLDGTTYVGWKITMLSRCFTVPGMLQLTITFHLNEYVTGTTTIKARRVLRTGVSTMVVHDAIVNDDTIIYATTDADNKAIMQDIQEVIKEYAEEVSEKANLHGNYDVDFNVANLNATNEVRTNKIREYLAGECIDIEGVFIDPDNGTITFDDGYIITYNGGEVANKGNVNAVKTYAKGFAKTMSLDSTTRVLTVKDANGTTLATIDLSKFAYKDSDTFNTPTLSAMGTTDSAIPSKKYVEDYVAAEFKKDANHIVFGTATLEDKTGKITIPYTLGGVSHTLVIDTNSEGMIKSQQLLKDDAGYYILITYYSGATDTLRLDTLTDVYGVDNDGHTVTLSIKDGNFSADLGEEAKAIFDAAETNEITRQSNESIRIENENTRIANEKARISSFDSKLDKVTSSSLKGYTRVYAVDENGNQAMVNADYYATKNAIVMRDANGKIYVVTPSVSTDAVNLGYLTNNYYSATDIDALAMTDTEYDSIMEDW